jgi:hypothetical protein
LPAGEPQAQHGTSLFPEVAVHRTRWIAAILAVVISLGLVAPATGAAAPRRTDLPDGWQPEGVTTDGRRLYVGSLADGALLKVDPHTGKRRLLHRGRAGWTAVGVEYDRWHHLVWVAGGATNVIRAHHAGTGRVRAVYTVPSEGERFVNDLVVTRRGVYATDSMNQELAVVPFRHGRLPRARAARLLDLTGDLVYEEGFNLNGIVRYRGRLLAVQSNTGLLFRIHPVTGMTRQVALRGPRLRNGDGLELRGRTLYAVRNRDNRISVVDLTRTGRRGHVVAQLLHAGFDVPTTVALAGRSLWAVNARFGTDPTEDTAYWINRLRAY